MNIGSLVQFMKSQGFERLSDYHDNSGCPMHYDGDILQFFNSETDKGVQFCIGPISDDAMFDDDMREEIKEKFYKHISTFRDDSGVGSTIHLWFRAKDNLVKEIKIFDDGIRNTFEFTLGDFNKDAYGTYGETFLNKIGENPEEY